MRDLRKAILLSVLAAIGFLMLLSVVGAFGGAERAKSFFNSVPLGVYWFLFAALLVAGFIFFRRLVTSPAGLAMHLGSLLILGGAIWGSDAGHDLRRAWLGESKVPRGFMVLHEGETADRLFDSIQQNEVGRLPFSLGLRNFSIDYYYAADKPWDLLLVVPVRDAAGLVVDEGHIPLVPGAAETAVPGTDLRVQYLQYVPAAASGLPSAEVLIRYPAGDRRAWLAPHYGEHRASLPLAVPPDATRPPALPKNGSAADASAPAEDSLGPTLFLDQPRGQPSSYKSDVVVFAPSGPESPVAEAFIEVNAPFHFGGYHIYQHSHGEDDYGPYTVLSVVSDSGLRAIWLGFALVALGTCGRMWGRLFGVGKGEAG